MKLSYVYAGLAVIIIGVCISIGAPFISTSLFRKNIVIEIPRKDFRLNVMRVWKGDIVCLNFFIQGGDSDLNLLIERVHFYIGPRMEQGAPARILTTKVYGPSIVNGSDSVTLNIDLEGHLNILLNNTYSSQPKTVKMTRVFERSTNVEYGTRIIRNLMLLAGGLMLFLGFLENYDQIIKRFRFEAHQVSKS